MFYKPTDHENFDHFTATVVVPSVIKDSIRLAVCDDYSNFH